MADINPQVRFLGRGSLIATWSGLADGDDGIPVEVMGMSHISLQAEGDASTVTISASLDGETFVDLTDDPDDTIVTLSIVPRYVAVSVTGGSDTKVILYAVAER